MKFLFGLLLLVSLAAAADQPRKAAAAGGSSSGGDALTSSRHPDLHPATLVRALDALRDGRRRLLQKETKKSEQYLDDPLVGHLRRVQVDDTCEDALAEAEESLAAYKAQEEAPQFLFVQMADDCIFEITDSGNLVLKSRRFHGDTVKFSDRPFTYEEEMPTESFFDTFDKMFNADNGGKPNAAITLFQNDESKDVVVSVFVKAVVKHRDDPDGPMYVYKLEQSDDQASVKSLNDVMGGKDKITYDHCSIFVDTYTPNCRQTCCGQCQTCDYQCQVCTQCYQTCCWCGTGTCYQYCC